MPITATNTSALTAVWRGLRSSYAFARDEHVDLEVVQDDFHDGFELRLVYFRERPGSWDMDRESYKVVPYRLDGRALLLATHRGPAAVVDLLRNILDEMVHRLRYGDASAAPVAPVAPPSPRPPPRTFWERLLEAA